MKYLLTGREMKLWEKKMMEKYKVPSILLMERAALAVFKELCRDAYDKHRVLVVCGCGNNGGDGAALARILKSHGIRVDICVDDSMKNQSEQYVQQMEMYQALGGSIVTMPEWDEYTVIVDAILGIGCNREIAGNTAGLIARMNECRAKIISIDIPSGVSADTGKVCGLAVHADTTVTFFTEKLGMVLYPGREYCGQIITDSLGLPFDVTEECRVCTYQDEDLQRIPRRMPDSHKGSYGKVLVIAGCEEICGAAYLAGAAGYAIGAGLVKIYTSAENKTALQTLLPEALLEVYHADRWDEDAFEKNLAWADVIVIGPGLGQSFTAREMLSTVFEKANVPLVIDADGINLLKDCKDCMKAYRNSIVLTPHILEMSRLSGVGRDDILAGPIAFAQKFVKEYPVTLVLKNARTIVISENENIYLNTSGNSGMAAGGSGDVLAGVIGGLIAQGMNAVDAAKTGVYIHGRAGDSAAARKGAYSMTAVDLLDGIAEVTRNETI